MNFNIGSEDRQNNRLKRRKCSKGKYYFWWFVHNCVAHPLIGICPTERFFIFHDYTSDIINGNIL